MVAGFLGAAVSGLFNFDKYLSPNLDLNTSGSFWLLMSTITFAVLFDDFDDLRRESGDYRPAASSFVVSFMVSSIVLQDLPEHENILFAYLLMQLSYRPCFSPLLSWACDLIWKDCTSFLVMTTERGFLSLQSPSKLSFSGLVSSPGLKVTFFLALLTTRSDWRGPYAEMFLMILGLALRTLLRKCLSRGSSWDGLRILCSCFELKVNNSSIFGYMLNNLSKPEREHDGKCPGKCVLKIFPPAFANQQLCKYHKDIGGSASIAQQQQLMEFQKATRRTKRDPQSRDFTCRCGKSYLSYAAAYTHVKQKHNLDKIYLDNIGKPQREKLPRGRPKQKKQAQIQSDIEELEILEEAILKMHTSLKEVFPRMIIEANDKMDPGRVLRQYGTLLAQLNKTFLEFREGLSSLEAQFVKDICMHFTEQVSARVRLVVNVAGTMRREGDVLDEESRAKMLNELGRVDLWRGKNQVNELILATYDSWRKLHQE